MNILFTVCARKGSKGVKNKNIREFLGYPLIYYTLSAIDLFKHSYDVNYKDIDVCISSDSKKLIELCSGFKDAHIINRPNELALDNTPKIDVIRHALNETESNLDKKYDYIIDLDITSPLRTISDIKAAIENSIKDKSIDVTFSVVESRRNPQFNIVKIERDKVVRAIESNFVTRQQAPKYYDMNASIYVYNKEFLVNKEKVGIFDGACSFIEMMDTGIIDIDSENDFEMMSVIAKYLYEINKSFYEVRENIQNIIQ